MRTLGAVLALLVAGCSGGASAPNADLPAGGLDDGAHLTSALEIPAGTTATGTEPRLSAKASHTARPTTTPRGTPMTIPTNANVLACHATADAT